MAKRLRWTWLLGMVWLWPLLSRAQTTPATPAPDGWAAVVTAHPDDWQLFMSASACEEVQHLRRKVVFVCLTGGQNNVPGAAFWRSREAASQASVRQAVNLKTPTANGPVVNDSILVLGHSVKRQRYRNTVAFFLELPDGGIDGKGQARGKFQSLVKLREGRGTLQPLSGGLVYASWDELLRTVRTLLQQEAVAGKLSVLTSQPDERLNPGDHSDHRMAGTLATAVTADVECRYVLHTGYDSGRRPVNMTSNQQYMQRQVYQAYCATMRYRGQPDGWDSSHLRFMGRQYNRVRHQAGTPMVPAPRPASGAPAGEDDPTVANEPTLEPVYPNPLSDSGLLVYYLPSVAQVWLRLLDMQGREVLQLHNGDVQEVGRHEYWLDVRRFPATGTYIAELRVNGHYQRQRLQVSQ